MGEIRPEKITAHWSPFIFYSRDSMAQKLLEPFPWISNGIGGMIRSGRFNE